jgi:hypothetical protein
LCFWIGVLFCWAFWDDVYDDDTSFPFLINEDFVFRCTEHLHACWRGQQFLSRRGVIVRNSDKLELRTCSPDQGHIEHQMVSASLLAHPKD